MKIINNVMKFTLWVWFCTLSLSCTKEIYRFNDSPDMFEVRKLGAYINRPIKELLDSLIHQKGMPQRILVYDKPIEWWAERASYTFEYVYPDSTFPEFK